jgi:GxxExxY protein
MEGCTMTDGADDDGAVAFQRKDREERKERKEVAADVERLARTVVDAGFKVHAGLGPGLLESAYEHFLAHELLKRGCAVRRQVALPIIYDGEKLDAGYRLDLVVNDLIIIEVKAVEVLTRLFEAQLLTYLKFSGYPMGFLMNFNVPMFKAGVRRFIR